MLTSSRDNWERLVAAVVKREEIWELCHQHSRTPSICTSVSSDDDSSQRNLSFSSSNSQRFSLPQSPLFPSKTSKMADAAVVTFLLEQVRGVIKGYVDLISGAYKKEFEKLKEEVEELKHILKDTANKSSEDHATRSTKIIIREVIYDVEDTIDIWLTEAKAKKKSKFGRSYNVAKHVKSLREEKMKDILEKANNIKEKINLQSIVPSYYKDRAIRQVNVVRLIDAEDNIIGHLTTPQMELDVIALIGMPGLGKTVTAWKIFNHEYIRSEFQTRIWVNFSESFNARDVLLKILLSFSSSNKDGVSSMSIQELSSLVHKCLNTEKFLLVIDDVWKKNHWDDIKHALPYANGKGKVLITSREMEVGRHVKHITNPLQMRFLTQSESWELLKLEVFGNPNKSCPEELQVIGEHIAKECKGVPLTVVVIGALLKEMYTRFDSLAMVYNKWQEIARNGHLLSDNRVDAIKEVVALSYHRLPDHLRECFLYLGVFPAGYKILTRTLTCLWIAEGFIQPDEENRSLEEIAEDNLNDLISRNLLMVHKMNPMQEVKVCCVHDVIRVFCINEASKQNLFQEAKMSEEGEDGDLASRMLKIRRLCLHSNLNNFFSANLEGPRVRSFLCFRKEVVDLESKYNSVIPENFLSLRVLHSKSIKFNEFPQSVTKLHHLRYIVLSVADLKILPQSLSQLWNLQTIIVDTNSHLLTMEANIWRMIRLRHVRTKAAIVLDKAGEAGEGGKNLQTLSRLSPESVTAAVCRKASKLKTLGIRGKLGPLFEDMPLGNLSHLEKLKLYQTEASENRLQHFPEVRCFPPNLKRLTLSKTFLEWKHMSTLAKIPGLEVLKLKENAFTGISWEAGQSHSAFIKLQVLHILNSDLVIWKASDSTFPCLRHLELKNCENLHAIPDDILGSLEKLDIGHVRKSIAYSAKNLALQLKFSAADLI